MNFKLTVLKGLKGLAFVLAGGVAATLVSPDFVQSAGALADSLAGGIPVVGAALKGVFASALVGLFAGLAASLENARKHWND